MSKSKSMAVETHPLPTRALPATVEDLEKQRTVKRTVTLIDEVEQCLLALFSEPKFRRYRDALEPEDTAEGSINADDLCAAQMIRAKGVELGLRQVEAANLTVLAFKLRRAEARFSASRNQRARMPELAQAAE